MTSWISSPEASELRQNHLYSTSHLTVFNICQGYQIQPKSNLKPYLDVSKNKAIVEKQHEQQGHYNATV
jgi:hypothetical protein